MASGYNALTSNTTASYNTAIGVNALGDANRTADANAYNTAIGYNAGNTGTNDITTGDNNVLLGAMTTASQAAASNQIIIGSGADGHGDNIAVIGNENLTAIHPGVDNAIDLGSSSYEYKNLYVDGTGYMDAVGFGSTSMTLPTADGSADQVIKTDGSGALGWTSISSTPSGAITMYAGGSVPSGWLFCNGAAVSRSTYSALFSAISTAYGAGDGSSTFNLPDFGGKGPMGYKSDNSKFDALAETGGEETHTLTTSEMPSHTHGYAGAQNTVTVDNQNLLTNVSKDLGNKTSSSTGGGSAHNVLDPYLTVNFIVKI